MKNRVGYAFVLYFILDISLRMTHFLQFGDYIGIKNFIPVTAGLVAGPVSGIGCALGCILAAFIAGGDVSETATECITIFMMSGGMWFLWYAGKKEGYFCLKRVEHYMRYLAALLFTAGLSGVAAGWLLSVDAGWELFISYVSQGILIAIPCLILLTSIFCIQLTVPKWIAEEESFAGQVGSVDELGAFNDALESYGQMHGIKMASVFGVENCVEEVFLRVKENDAGIKIRVIFKDTVSCSFSYAGKKNNPFLKKKHESEEDSIGLKLIRCRALRASYTYRKKVNYVHIVM